MITFPDDQDNFGATIQEFPSDGLEELAEEDGADEDGDVVILGKGTRENLKFEWKTTPWSVCSQTCGGNGYQFRTMRCVVRSVFSVNFIFPQLFYFTEICEGQFDHYCISLTYKFVLSNF